VLYPTDGNRIADKLNKRPKVSVSLTRVSMKNIPLAKKVLLVNPRD